MNLSLLLWRAGPTTLKPETKTFTNRKVVIPGFRLQGSGFRVQDSGGPGLEFKVSKAAIPGCRASNFGHVFKVEGHGQC